ncbi:MAG TPA: hypothetical protein VN654_07105 [Vicinamibacterales bacterium]|nr:hypothetical protein [Vicinamibacterales bacterium]
MKPSLAAWSIAALFAVAVSASGWLVGSWWFVPRTAAEAARNRDVAD